MEKVRENAHRPADLAGQDDLDAHRLRRAYQVALRAVVDRICRIADVNGLA
jgi:hypothetical protein